MRTRQAGMLITGMLAVGGGLLAGCTLEQIMIGQWYRIDTPAAGACPALAWRFVVNPQRSINGLLSGNVTPA